MSSKPYESTEELEPPQTILIINKSKYPNDNETVVDKVQISASDKRKFVRKINKYNSYLKSFINQLEGGRCKHFYI